MGCIKQGVSPILAPAPTWVPALLALLLDLKDVKRLLLDSCKVSEVNENNIILILNAAL